MEIYPGWTEWKFILEGQNGNLSLMDIMEIDVMLTPRVKQLYGEQCNAMVVRMKT